MTITLIRTSDENQMSLLFRQNFFPLHFLFFLITAKRFKISSSGFLCLFQDQRGQLLKFFLHPPSIFKAWVCPDYFVQSLILLMGRSLLILGNLINNLAARGKFVKHDFTNAMQNVRSLAPNVSEMSHCVFYHMFYPYIEKLWQYLKMPVNSIACHYSKTIQEYQIQVSCVHFRVKTNKLKKKQKKTTKLVSTIFFKDGHNPVLQLVEDVPWPAGLVLADSCTVKPQLSKPHQDRMIVFSS